MNESPKKRSRRNTLQVKEDIIKAVGSVLSKQGFNRLGISLVAEEAHVDKTVIYRNFNDFEHLLEIYIERQDYWIKALKLVGNSKIDNYRAFSKKLFTDQFLFIYSNKEVQELLIWELGDHSKLTQSIPMRREAMSQGLLLQCKAYFKDTGIDFNSIAALIISGIYFSILHMDKSTFCNTDIRQKADKEKFIAAIEWMVDQLFDAVEEHKQMEEVARRCLKEGLAIDVIERITGFKPSEINKLRPAE